MGVITFNGKNSSEFGLTVTKCPYPNKPARRGTVLQIPGRSGNLVIEDGTYENVILKFDVDISAYHQYGIYDLASKIANWLLGSSGYQKLSTDYEPDTFRLARFSGPMEIESILLFDGRATLEFDCYPQRFESLGHVYSDYGSLSSGSATITNTGIMIAKPMIKVTGKGKVVLDFASAATGNTTEVDFAFSSSKIETIILDCDLHDAYYEDGSNANAAVSFSDAEASLPESYDYFYPTFPELTPGSNTVTLSSLSTGTLSGLKIMPRWWSL
ncbi:MAG: hypothetical protein U0N08_01815 [Oscillospiraceae bacterium]